MKYEDVVIGKTYRVTRAGVSGAGGWRNSWAHGMNKYIGKEGVAERVEKGGVYITGFAFSSGRTLYGFPWNVLEPTGRAGVGALPKTDSETKKLMQLREPLAFPPENDGVSIFLHGEGNTVLKGGVAKKALNEIYTSNMWSFAFLSEDNTLLHQPVMCRDFLHDIVRTEMTGEPFEIYNLKYSRLNQDTLSGFCHGKVKMALFHDTEEENYPHLPKALHLLHLFEEAMGFTQSFIKPAVRHESKKKGYIIEADRGWMCSPRLLWLFTFTLRLGKLVPDGVSFSSPLHAWSYLSILPFLKIFDEREHNTKYLGEITKHICPEVDPYNESGKKLSGKKLAEASAKVGERMDFLFSNYKRYFKSIEQEYKLRKEVDIYDFHNHSGFLSFLSENDGIPVL